MKLAFTSCYMGASQPVWDQIAAYAPDHLFLLGDNIYMDYGVDVGLQTWRLKLKSPADYEAMMRSRYETQFAVANYRSLVNSMRTKGGLHVIWDDHDFAWDNSRGGEMAGDTDVAKKNISRRLFNQYFYPGQPEDRNIFHSVDTPLARFILLDNRSYFVEGNPLGKPQPQLPQQPDEWAFLTDAINTNTLPYTIVCSGITLRNGSEQWSKHPEGMRMLMQLLNSKDRGLIFLSGDVHDNHFYAPGAIRAGGVVYDAKFYEFVSSGASLIKFVLFGIGRRQNWGSLELQADHFDIRLHGLKPNQNYSARVLWNDWKTPLPQPPTP